MKRIGRPSRAQSPSFMLINFKHLGKTCINCVLIDNHLISCQLQLQSSIIIQRVYVT